LMPGELSRAPRPARSPSCPPTSKCVQFGSSTFQVDPKSSPSGGDEARHARESCDRETQRENAVGVRLSSSVPFRPRVPPRAGQGRVAPLPRWPQGLTGTARGGLPGGRVGTKGWPPRSNKGMAVAVDSNPQPWVCAPADPETPPIPLERRGGLLPDPRGDEGPAAGI